MKSTGSQLLWPLCVLAVTFILLLWLRRDARSPNSLPSPPPAASPFPAADPIAEAATRVMEERKELDATVWAQEVRAQNYERTLIAFWDGIRRSSNRFGFVRDFDLPWLTVGRAVGQSDRAHEIQQEDFSRGDIRWDRTAFKDWLDRLERSGLEIVQTEWHHKQFLPGGEQPDASIVNFTVHAARPEIQERLALTGDLRVTWNPVRDASGCHPVAEVAVERVSLQTRTGPAAFEEVRLPGEAVHDVIPVTVHDLDEDGRPDIYFLQHNVVYWNRGGMNFERGRLFAGPPPGVSAQEFAMVKVNLRSVFGDFTGDGRIDALVGVPRHGLFLYEADGDGRFTGPARSVFKAAPGQTFDYFSAFTAGDVNGDGLLDAWITQYRVPYDRGFMPLPYYSATNGHPSFLLVNDGSGGFRDVTEDSGLGGKRRRLTLSASFVDLDHDGDLDLVNVADYCGTDVYLNDGKGRFTDVTDRYLDEPFTFGMGHVLGDFSGDGRVDLFVTGMGSTTARRLEALGLNRPGHDEENRMRMRMGYGNRMYLGGKAARMQQPAFRDRVARSGWSWGVAALDFGNDGDLDAYVANGFISAGSCKDYCTRFWTHDVYTKGVRSNPVLDAVHNLEWQEAGLSWNGYEKNVLFVNEGGTNFFNAGFLMDVGFVYDSRSVVTEDFDGDGRVDLGVVQLDTSGRVGGDQRFHLYRNVWTGNGSWIGVRLRGAPGVSAMGARVTVETPERTLSGVMVSGDSYFAQQSRNLHFGLGTGGTVRAIHVDWINGRRTTLEEPAVGRYHSISAAR